MEHVRTRAEGSRYTSALDVASILLPLLDPPFDQRS
jgi:hypothetical protein